MAAGNCKSCNGSHKVYSDHEMTWLDCEHCDEDGNTFLREKSKVVSLAAARFNKISEASEHNPRDALEAAMEYLDEQGTEGPQHVIVCFGGTPEDGGSATKWFQAGSYEYHAQIGLLFEAGNMIRENG